MILIHFKCQLSRKKKVPRYLDVEGDFVLACLRTCEGSLSCGNYTGSYHHPEDDVLAGIAILVA